MPRLPRFVLPGHPQHVIQRGNNRCPIFITDEDFGRFLDHLVAACDRHAGRIHAYVLMTNHVHLLMTPEHEDSIGRIVQSAGRRYVQYFNQTYRRTGTLWEGRYKATLVDTAHYLLTCMRYIELNPVRAGMAAHPGDYRWSSYRANAQGHADPLVRPHPVFRSLGADADSRHAAYRDLFQAHLDEGLVAEIRKATQKGWALGNDRFHDEIAAHLGRRTRPLPHGGDHRSDEFRSRFDKADPINPVYRV